MPSNEQTTIAAIATPLGKGGVGIVRVSGPQAKAITSQVVGKSLTPRMAHYGPFADPSGELLDMGIALFFPGPHSYTGEDVLELQGHGGPVVMDRLLRCCLAHGATLATPGEFTERAFLNDKIDLAQAEAIADLIDSASEQAARSAVRSLQGEFSQQIHALVDELTQLRLYVEAAIDFPEEEIDFLNDGVVVQRLSALLEQFTQLLHRAQQGALLRDGMTLVIAGKPNAGKSTLLNCLSGRDSAIVTDIPGTTRDVMREYIHLNGMPLHIIDTAGLRETEDAVEQEGVRRAWQEIAKADHVLLLIDVAEQDNTQALLAQFAQTVKQHPPVTVVYNKIDTLGLAAKSELEQTQPQIFLSAKQQEGISLLTEHLQAIMGFEVGNEGCFSARRRHLQAITQAQAAVKLGAEQLQQLGAGELLAEELRIAQQYLGEITGKVSSDDLLGKIFSSFCIGK